MARDVHARVFHAHVDTPVSASPASKRQPQAFANDFHVSLAVHDGEHLYESASDYAEAPAE